MKFWYFISGILGLSLYMHVHLSSGARDIHYGMSLHLCPYIVYGSSEGSRKTAHLHILI